MPSVHLVSRLCNEFAEVDRVICAEAMQEASERDTFVQAEIVEIVIQTSGDGTESSASIREPR